MEMKTLYRLIILYLLRESEQPLSNTMITGFVLDKEYTNYFTLQETIRNLIDTGLIIPESVHGNTLYYLTDEGMQTVEYFHEKISDSIKNDIYEFLEKINVSDDDAVPSAEYEKTGDNRYDVTCSIKNRKRAFLRLTMSVSTEEQADAVCRNWEKQYINAYTNLLDLLLQ